MKKLLFSAIIALPLMATAQKHHEIGLSAGVSTFFGDVQPNLIPEDNSLMRPSFGVLYKFYPNPHVGFRFAANYINLMGADSLSQNKTYQRRNLSFRNNMAEVYGAIELNLLPVGPDQAKFSPFVFVGVGAFYTNPYSFDKDGKKVFLRDLSTEGQGIPGYMTDRKIYPVISAAFPIGAGFKFLIGRKVMLTAEACARYTSTDYIDDVSKTYVNLDTLNKYKGSEAVSFSYRGNQNYKWDGNYPNNSFQRGDFKGNDWYWTAGITATIYFDAIGNVREFVQTKCPRIFGRGIIK